VRVLEAVLAEFFIGFAEGEDFGGSELACERLMMGGEDRQRTYGIGIDEIAETLYFASRVI
jgi:hypothetical protein